jgi:hypothetical protein
MTRRPGPDHRDPMAFAGLTQRRLERGQPVGPIPPVPNFPPFQHPHHNRKDVPK